MFPWMHHVKLMMMSNLSQLCMRYYKGGISLLLLSSLKLLEKRLVLDEDGKVGGQPGGFLRFLRMQMLVRHMCYWDMNQRVWDRYESSSLLDPSKSNH